MHELFAVIEGNLLASQGRQGAQFIGQGISKLPQFIASAQQEII